MIAGVLPTAVSNAPAAHCLMFYEYENVLGEDWLECVEQMFSANEQVPAIAVANLGSDRAKGKYERVKARLRDLLRRQADESAVDVRIDSEHAFPDDAFFPCRMRVAWSTSIGGLRQGVVAVRGSASSSELTRMVERTCRPLFKKIGVAYAHAFTYPAAYGPDFYLSAVGAIPSGHSSLKNMEYAERLTRWRDNTWHRRKRPSEGYLREVYPINFLMAGQVERAINGQSLKDYMTRTGTLRPCESIKGRYRWDVPDSLLAQARRDLEGTGIVLSAV